MQDKIFLLGLVNAENVSDDKGRLSENMVFLQLRRKYKLIYYFNEHHECDFVIHERGNIALFEVSWQLDMDNLDREINGLIGAMDFFKVNTGTIITFDQEDVFYYREEKNPRDPIL